MGPESINEAVWRAAGDYPIEGAFMSNQDVRRLEYHGPDRETIVSSLTGSGWDLSLFRLRRNWLGWPRNMSGSDDTAVVIATVSLGVSVSTFLWKIAYDLYFDRPRLRVQVSTAIVGVDPEPVEAVIVTATNVGRQPTVLTSLWLHFGRPRRRWGRLLPKRRRENLFRGAALIPPPSLRNLMTGMPKRLEIGDHANTYYELKTARDELEKSDFSRWYGHAEGTTASQSSRPRRPAK